MISLVPIRKRKDLQGTRPPSRDKTKIRLVAKPTDIVLDACSKSRARTSIPGSRTWTTFRKRSIRIFSRLRSGNGKSMDHAITSSNGSHPTAIETSQATTTARIPIPLRKLSIPEIPISISLPAFHRRNSSSPPLTNTTGFDGESEPALPTQPLHRPIQTSKSAPGLSRKFSSRLSEALLPNTTVIHRPNMSSKPAISTNNFEPPGTQSQPATSSQPAISDLPSLPSSVLSSSTSPLTLSSPPTSFMSSGGPISAETVQRAQAKIPFAGNSAPAIRFFESSRKQRGPPPLMFPRQDSPRLVKPSVATIENAAAAKVFFESHYNQLLATKVSSRSMRRRRMEHNLFTMALPNEQRQQKRREWYVAESYHLRQTRAMKSKTLARQRMKGVHVSNYDIVRVLGKGSFGVVRLVRPKTQPDPPASPNSSVHCPDDALMQGNKAMQVTPKSNQIFAMKIIRKSDMLRNSQEGHLRAERDFLVASENSRWVVPLMAAFQDNNHLYLVMEYMIGGDFLGLLLREDVLDEGTAKWYLAEMILCIEEAHRMNWIHRDVKPDNFLITASGHLKISDFGLAFDGHWIHNQTYYNERRYELLRDLEVDIQGDGQDIQEEKERQGAQKILNLMDGSSGAHSPVDLKQDAGNGTILDNLNRHQRRQFARSVVGTSQYMAPEVIKGECYDGRCDWWSIGIILYECLYGTTPFFCDSRQATKARILDHHNWLRFPPEQRYARPNYDRVPLPPVTRNAIDLMMKLLEDRPARLSTKRYRENDWTFRDEATGNRRARNVGSQGHCCFPNDAEDIKAHPFFRNTHWAALHMTRPPFLPRVHDGQPITKYFEDEADILGTSDHLHSSSYEVSPEEGGVPIPDAAVLPHDGQADNNTTRIDKLHYNTLFPSTFKNLRRRVREKKRARDKMLRDPLVGRTVLELRKKGAFLGYTYRRPMFALPDWEDKFVVNARPQRTRPSAFAISF